MGEAKRSWRDELSFVEVARFEAANGFVCRGTVAERTDVVWPRNAEPLPWMAEAGVDEYPLATSHHATRAEAEAEAVKMAKCYAFKVHGRAREAAQANEGV